MFILFAGPSCSGKSTAARTIASSLNCQIYTGKDYLRLAKNEQEAWGKFIEICRQAATKPVVGEHSVIYIVNDLERFNELVEIKALKILFDAEQNVLEERFKPRTGGMLPPPVKIMLQRQKQKWSTVAVDHAVDTTLTSTEESAAAVWNKIKESE